MGTEVLGRSHSHVTYKSAVTITALGELSLFILKNMDPETVVVAMDNHSQGIRTIGDIINHPGFVEIDWDLIPKR